METREVTVKVTDCYEEKDVIVVKCVNKSGRFYAHWKPTSASLSRLDRVTAQAVARYPLSGDAILYILPDSQPTAQ